MPLRHGHTLVIPKLHTSRVSDLPDEFAAECGKAVSKLSRAISGGASHFYASLGRHQGASLTPALAVNNTALNVVCNQEYAQAVPHVRPLYARSTHSIESMSRRCTTTSYPLQTLEMRGSSSWGMTTEQRHSRRKKCTKQNSKHATSWMTMMLRTL